ncbi:unnamed protein product [Closterium sp. NIES-53]
MIIDGLGRECPLSDADMGGIDSEGHGVPGGYDPRDIPLSFLPTSSISLLASPVLFPPRSELHPPLVTDRLVPYLGHAGVVTAARDFPLVALPNSVTSLLTPLSVACLPRSELHPPLVTDRLVPYFGHAGVVTAARDLALQLDNMGDGGDEERKTNLVPYLKRGGVMTSGSKRSSPHSPPAPTCSPSPLWPVFPLAVFPSFPSRPHMFPLSPVACFPLRSELHPPLVTDRLVPYFGHAGVVTAARDLALQLDNMGDGEDEEGEGTQGKAGSMEDGGGDDEEGSLLGQKERKRPRRGILSELLGEGGECEGYGLRLVGHSMGGAVCSLTAIRLRKRFPELRAIGYGSMPCVDFATASACSNFITTFVYNDEFSPRTSVASVMRLRAAALRAVAADTRAGGLLGTAVAAVGPGAQAGSAGMRAVAVDRLLSRLFTLPFGIGRGDEGNEMGGVNRVGDGMVGGAGSVGQELGLRNRSGGAEEGEEEGEQQQREHGKPKLQRMASFARTAAASAASAASAAASSAASAAAHSAQTALHHAAHLSTPHHHFAFHRHWGQRGAEEEEEEQVLRHGLHMPRQWKGLGILPTPTKRATAAAGTSSAAAAAAGSSAVAVAAAARFAAAAASGADGTAGAGLALAPSGAGAVAAAGGSRLTGYAREDYASLIEYCQAKGDKGAQDWLRENVMPRHRKKKKYLWGGWGARRGWRGRDEEGENGGDGEAEGRSGVGERGVRNSAERLEGVQEAEGEPQRKKESAYMGDSAIGGSNIGASKPGLKPSGKPSLGRSISDLSSVRGSVGSSGLAAGTAAATTAAAAAAAATEAGARGGGGGAEIVEENESGGGMSSESGGGMSSESGGGMSSESGGGMSSETGGGMSSETGGGAESKKLPPDNLLVGSAGTEPTESLATVAPATVSLATVPPDTASYATVAYASESQSPAAQAPSSKTPGAGGGVDQARQRSVAGAQAPSSKTPGAGGGVDQARQRSVAGANSSTTSSSSISRSTRSSGKSNSSSSSRQRLVKWAHEAQGVWCVVSGVAGFVVSASQHGYCCTKIELPGQQDAAGAAAPSGDGASELAHSHTKIELPEQQDGADAAAAAGAATAAAAAADNDAAGAAAPSGDSASEHARSRTKHEFPGQQSFEPPADDAVGTAAAAGADNDAAGAAAAGAAGAGVGAGGGGGAAPAAAAAAPSAAPASLPAPPATTTHSRALPPLPPAIGGGGGASASASAAAAAGAAGAGVGVGGGGGGAAAAAPSAPSAPPAPATTTHSRALPPLPPATAAPPSLPAARTSSSDAVGRVDSDGSGFRGSNEEASAGLSADAASPGDAASAALAAFSDASTGEGGCREGSSPADSQQQNHKAAPENAAAPAAASPYKLPPLHQGRMKRSFSLLSHLPRRSSSANDVALAAADSDGGGSGGSSGGDGGGWSGSSGIHWGGSGGGRGNHRSSAAGASGAAAGAAAAGARRSASGSAGNRMGGGVTHTRSRPAWLVEQEQEFPGEVYVLGKVVHIVREEVRPATSAVRVVREDKGATSAVRKVKDDKGATSAAGSPEADAASVRIDVGNGNEGAICIEIIEADCNGGVRQNGNGSARSKDDGCEGVERGEGGERDEEGEGVERVEGNEGVEKDSTARGSSNGNLEARGVDEMQGAMQGEMQGGSQEERVLEAAAAKPGLLESFRSLAGSPFSSSRHRSRFIPRESLRDLLVSPSMFLDHLPWRMSHAFKDLLQDHKAPA